VTRHLPWRRSIASLNYLLTSHVWRQDHNGFQPPGPWVIDHVINKKAETGPRVFAAGRQYTPFRYRPLPAQPRLRQRNRRRQTTLPSVARHGRRHCPLHRRHRIWEWASTDRGSNRTSVMACCGDVPTAEPFAAVEILRRHFPELKVRVI